MNAPEEPKRKRPKMVWAIIIYYSISLCYSGLSVYLVLYKGLFANEELQDVISNFGTFSYIAMVIGMLLTLLGIIMLFRLKQTAFFFFGFALLIGLISWLYYLLRTGFEGIGSIYSQIGSAIGILISFTIVLYLKRLIDKKVLT